MEEDPERLGQLVEVWHGACAAFVRLVRDLSPAEADLPTDLEGWSVKDNVAHTAHLEAVLAGAPEETVEVAEAPRLRSPMHRYTEQGVLARRDHDLGRLADEIEGAVATRYAALRADPPTDGSVPAPRTFSGLAWDIRTLLSNRALDVWMHDQDVRRATARSGGFDSPAATHVLGVFASALPMIVGKRLAPPPGTRVRLAVPAAGLDRTVLVGADGRAAATDDDGPFTTSVTLSPEELVVLAGGRRTPGSTSPTIEGDAELAHRLLRSLTVTP